MYLLELAGDDDAFARREAASRGSAVEALAPGLATARGIRRPETLAYTRRVCRLIGTCDPMVADAAALLSAATIDRRTGDGERGSVAVRARDVRGLSGVDTQAAERRLGDVLVDRGFDVDLEAPDHTLVALFSETAALGWLEAETDRGFGARQPTDRPFFQPGSMAPMDARALANVAGAGPDARLLDPMCGTGGILVEAGVDAPYGRQSKIEGDSLETLVGGALAAARRVAPRAVLVGDRPWNDAAEAAGWSVIARFDRPVHGSLTRHVHVLS
ncbi:TIGR01177 family methyltransferase [Halobacteriales archaeon QH_10_70_21]|nr:MAG: TIGR01177 family methyltransferase [Halobacteriales archaeon QH_10_70_21]